MDNIMVSKIENFTIEGLDTFHIAEFNYMHSQDAESLSTLLSPGFYEKFGSIYKKEYINTPFFYKKAKLKDKDEFFKGLLISHDYLENVIHFLWLVKDCCPHLSLTQGYLPEINLFLVEHSPKVHTKADGTYTSTAFNHSEINEAYTLLNHAFPLSNDQSEPGIKSPEEAGSGFISSDSSVEYSKLTRIDRAYRFVRDARRRGDLSQKIALNVLALECLFSANDSIEISHKLGERIAIYIGDGFDGRVDIYKNFIEAYSIRSKYIHGQALEETKKFKYKNLIELSIYIDALLRAVMRRIYLLDSEKFLASSNDQKKWFTGLLFAKEFEPVNDLGNIKTSESGSEE